MSVAAGRIAAEAMTVRRLTAYIFFAALAAFASVSPQDPGNFQVITRLALPLSIVERHELNIDTYAERTGDKAEWDGHFYADKPPGHPLLALPSVLTVRGILGALGRPVEGSDRGAFAIYAFWATVTVNGLLSALAASALFTTALRLGASLPGAVFGSAALALGTPFFGWSAAFFAHSVSGSLLILAFAIAVRLLGREPARGGLYWSLLLGVLLGYAPVVELTAAPLTAAGVVVFALAALRRGGRRHLALVGAAMAGSVLGFLPLPLYNYFAFGSPTHLGYASVVGWEGMQQGFFGITLPDFWIALALLLSPYRGLVPLSPVLILAPVGLVTMMGREQARFAGILCLLVFGAYLLVNSSYHYWVGGWSMGPRHLVAGLPFLGLALCFVWPEKRRLLQLPALLLLVVSFEFSLIAAAGGMFPPERFNFPLYDFALQRLLSPEGEWWRVPLVVLTWLAFGAIGTWANATRPAAAGTTE